MIAYFGEKINDHFVGFMHQTISYLVFRTPSVSMAWSYASAQTLLSGKTTPSSPERDLNLNLPILGSLAQHATRAIANYATEAGETLFMKIWFVVHQKTSLIRVVNRLWLNLDSKINCDITNPERNSCRPDGSLCLLALSRINPSETSS
uniref:Uncharacterized protein n=1 Tax=Timema monikensis TaxID=170555 RepID=A0A7R9HSS2_9NEOP|nr:unnamed protein product [Timema monikensis]